MLSILLGRDNRQSVLDVFFKICGNPLQAADGHWLLFNPAPSAGGFTGSVAGTPEYSGENIAVPIHHIRIGIALFGDQSNVFRNGGMSGASPLAIHYFVEIFRIGDIRRLHGWPLLLFCFWYF